MMLKGLKVLMLIFLFLILYPWDIEPSYGYICEGIEGLVSSYREVDRWYRVGVVTRVRQTLWYEVETGEGVLRLGYLPECEVVSLPTNGD